MFSNAEQYQLSFVFPKRRQNKKPQIVFSVREEGLYELEERLRKVVQHINVAEYLGIEEYFFPPFPDLLGNNCFGFGKCGFFNHKEGKVHLHINIDSDIKLLHSTLTIHVLTIALAVPMETIAPSNQEQQIELETICEVNRPSGHGHAIGGYVSSQMGSWLLALGTETAAKEGSNALPSIVIAAMRSAWRAAVHDKKLRKYADDCWGNINHDGRFALGCFGNACDVAIYPEGSYTDVTRGYTRFSCHNLDAAMQQITFIAGLAQLCELARKN